MPGPAPGDREREGERADQPRTPLDNGGVNKGGEGAGVK